MVTICYTVSTLSRTPLFRRTRFPLAPTRPMGFRRVWAPNSCFMHQVSYSSIENRQNLLAYRQRCFNTVTDCQTDKLI